MKKCRIILVLCAVIFAAAYKAAARHFFSGQPRLAGECVTPYGGVAVGVWEEFVQTGEETCGHAALAFFLTGAGFPVTEEMLIKETGSAKMLSLAGLEYAAAKRGLKTQTLKVEPVYFRKHLTTAILHLSSRHFIVFLGETKSEAEIFDPACGKVFVPWKTLLRLFSGYMLYIYQ